MDRPMAWNGDEQRSCLMLFRGGGANLYDFTESRCQKPMFLDDGVKFFMPAMTGS